MLIDSIDKFTAIIPTAEGSEWEAIEPFMTEAEAWTQNEFLGAELFDHIAALPAGNSVLYTLMILLANKAYSLAIPYVDLIQTPTGFAVVNNTNLLPASQQRVDRLLQTTINWFGVKMNALIGMIESDPVLLAKWRLSAVFQKMTETIFWRPSDIILLGATPTGNWDLLTQNQTTILAFQSGILADWISIEYMNELLLKRQNGALSSDDKTALRLIQSVAVNLLGNHEESAEKILNTLVNYMEKTPNAFATYIASDIYAIKIGTKYQNQKTDKTFFFGT